MYLNISPGKKKFLFGDKATEFDCSLFGSLSQILWHAPGSPQRHYIKGSCFNITICVIKFVDFSKKHHLYRPQQSCEGYVFAPVRLSTGGGQGLPQCMLGYPPETRHPLAAGTPWSKPPWHPHRTRHPPFQEQAQPPGAGTPRSRHIPQRRHPPPADGHSCGQYAS